MNYGGKKRGDGRLQSLTLWAGQEFNIIADWIVIKMIRLTSVNDFPTLLIYCGRWFIVDGDLWAYQRLELKYY